MYQIEAWSALRKARHDRRPDRSWFSVSRNVWALGVTSLFTDIASEMVGTVLPIYLVLHLGLTPFHYGIVDGLYHGVTALLRLLSGVVVDRSNRCKELAFVGYGISAVSRLGLLFAGVSWPLIASVVAVDRAAKGLRTVPRDVLISLSSQPATLATSFGVHRALDSAGAMLGPLVALAILAALPEAFDVVFVCSFSVAVCGVGVLVFFVRNPKSRASVPETGGVLSSLSEFRRGLQDPRLLRLTVAATLLSAATVSDGFIYLVLQDQVGFNAGLFPLLYVGTSASYLALAVPAGRLADRVGRRTALLTGYCFLALSYLLTMQSDIGITGLVGCLLLLGTHYALTDGVLMAFASGFLPIDRRGTGLAALTTATSLTRLGASVIFGVLWTQLGLRVALAVFAVGLLLAVSFAFFIVERDTTRDVDSDAR